MTRFVGFVLLMAMTALGTEITSPSVSSDQNSRVTFNKDVLPILQNNCQECHRPSGIAPMSFLTYENTRPWAKAIKSAVVTKQMPPWFADSHSRALRNAPKLTSSDINVLSVWADNGAIEGNAADKVPAREWKEGWRIQPDVVVSMPEPYRVASRGAGEVREFFVQNPFQEDTWITSIEIRPGDPSVVHHVLVQVPEQTAVAGARKLVFLNGVQASASPEDTAALLANVNMHLEAPAARLAGGQNPTVVFRSGNGQGGSYSDQLVRLQERQTGRGAFTTMEAVYAPGSQPLDFRYTDSAKLIQGGKPIRLEVHYTPNGKETTDQTMVGFTLAKTPPQRRFVIMAPDHLIDDRRPIPAGEANWESSGELTFTQDAELAWFMPHMHLRGKDMTFRLVYPDGREETALSARFDFNWQLGYELEEPIKLPKGTKMIVTAHHDNSANNRANPSPGQPATWGEMTSQEMMLPWFGVIVDGDAKPEMIASYRPGHLNGVVTPQPGVAPAFRFVTR